MLRWKERPFVTSPSSLAIVMPVSIPTRARGDLPQSSIRSPSSAEQTPPSAARWPVFLAAAVIVVAVVAAYANSFSGAMVLDDHTWILQNHRIQNPSSIVDLLLPGGVVGGRPLVSLSLALNY